jgi:hypothetical protein
MTVDIAALERDLRSDLDYAREMGTVISRDGHYCHADEKCLLGVVRLVNDLDDCGRSNEPTTVLCMAHLELGSGELLALEYGFCWPAHPNSEKGVVGESAELRALWDLGNKLGVEFCGPAPEFKRGG